MRTTGRRCMELLGLASWCVLASPSPVFAHAVDARFGDFYGGMLHPVTAVEQLLPLIGLSLLAGQQTARQARWNLLALPLGLLLGAVGGLAGSPLSWVEWINRSSLLAVGLAVVAAVRVPLPVLFVASVALGVSHGYENVADITSTVSVGRFLPGLVCTGICLAAVFAALAVCARPPWQTIAVRVAGSWIAAVGLLMLAAE